MHNTQHTARHNDGGPQDDDDLGAASANGAGPGETKHTRKMAAAHGPGMEHHVLGRLEANVAEIVKR